MKFLTRLLLTDPTDIRNLIVFFQAGDCHRHVVITRHDVPKVVAELPFEKLRVFAKED